MNGYEIDLSLPSSPIAPSLELKKNYKKQQQKWKENHCFTLCINLSLLNHLLLDMWVAPNFWLLQIKLLRTFVYKSLDICFQVTANLKNSQASAYKEILFSPSRLAAFKNCEFWWGCVRDKKYNFTWTKWNYGLVEIFSRAIW